MANCTLVSTRGRNPTRVGGPRRSEIPFTENPHETSYILPAAGVLAATVLPATAADISGAGATFPYPISPNGPTPTRKETGIGLNYQSIGSGGGIKQISHKTVMFGATDKPLRRRSRQERPRPVSDRHGRHRSGRQSAGIKPGDLVIDGPTLAKIFLGQIKNWNDPAIKKLNPGRQTAQHRDRRRASLGRFGHHLQFHRLSREGQPRLEIEGRCENRGRMAGRHRRQGQRRRRQQRSADQGLDRLCRIRLRHAEQADLCQHDQQGRQDRHADRGGLPGRRRQRGLDSVRRASASSSRTSRAPSPGQ